MEKEERLTKQIKTVYTEIAKRLVAPPSHSQREGKPNANYPNLLSTLLKFVVENLILHDL